MLKSCRVSYYRHDVAYDFILPGHCSSIISDGDALCPRPLKIFSLVKILINIQDGFCLQERSIEELLTISVAIAVLEDGDLPNKIIIVNSNNHNNSKFGSFANVSFKGDCIIWVPKIDREGRN